ncbi:unannotated protein [freshwater metagenome]|uniref:Unannotated protein n=1 Tax=freshwater metagenome TaxID=449393 RepID=A0A6J7KIK2_9ZZZZ
MAPIVGSKGWRLGVAAQLTIDESTAVALSRETPEHSKRGFWWTGVAVFVFWNSLTFVGAYAGKLIGSPEQYGLDAAAAAAFVGLVWPRLKSVFTSVAAIVALVVAVVTSIWLPAGIPVIVAGFVVVALVNIYFGKAKV